MRIEVEKGGPSTSAADEVHVHTHPNPFQPSLFRSENRPIQNPHPQAPKKPQKSSPELSVTPPNSKWQPAHSASVRIPLLPQFLPCDTQLTPCRPHSRRRHWPRSHPSRPPHPRSAAHQPRPQILLYASRCGLRDVPEAGCCAAGQNGRGAEERL